MKLVLKKAKIGLATDRGYTLLELIVTLVVLSILIMGTIPLTQNAVKRDKEIRLRETLRDIRNAIDEFKRDSVGSCPAGAVSSQRLDPNGAGVATPTDPRSRVVIDDCTIFDSQNLDRYPPSLDTLVKGVKVRQRGVNLIGGSGINANSTQATELNQDKEVKKIYLREVPIDPMTGKSDWVFRSSYQDKDSSWDQINVFDVRSSSDGEALNGDKYSDW